MFLDLRNKMPNIRHDHFLSPPLPVSSLQVPPAVAYDLAVCFVVRQELCIDFSAEGRNKAIWEKRQLALLEGTSALFCGPFVLWKYTVF